MKRTRWYWSVANPGTLVSPCLGAGMTCTICKRLTDREIEMRRALLLTLMLLLAGVVHADAQPADKVTLELNRLTAGQGGCQVFMIGRNDTGRAFKTLQADLVTFAGDGVVNGRLLVELAPLDPGKTVLRLFELPEVPCEAIDRVLLNEVARCEDGSGAVPGCTATVETSSRAKPGFFK
jgi:hypothetical protein